MSESQPSPSTSMTIGTVPSTGVLLGLDYGTRRIGVAVTTSEQRMSLPLETYIRRSESLDRDWLKKVARDYRAVALVIGLPVHMSGQEGEKAQMARAFGGWAAEHTGLPVAFWDERYSSAAADYFLAETSHSRKNKISRRDQLAAHVILSSYIEAPDRSAKPAEFQTLVKPEPESDQDIASETVDAPESSLDG